MSECSRPLSVRNRCQSFSLAFGPTPNNADTVGWLHPGIRHWSPERQKKPAAGATQPRMLPIAALLVSGFAHHATRHLPARAAFPPRGAFPIPTVVADGQASTTVVDSGVRPDHHMMDTTAGAASTRALSVIMKSSDLTDTSASIA